MFIITPKTISNRAALEFRQIPRRFLGRSFVWPRQGGGWRLKLRLVFEIELLRYLVALAPFAVAALAWRDSALAIAQAPALMVLVIYGVEMRFLRLSKSAREALLTPADRDRLMDLLAERSRKILTRIGAGRRLAGGALHLVIEQSELARVPPLTLVSVQSDDGPAILDLTDADCALIRETLFATPLTEDVMHTLSLTRKDMVCAISLEMRSIPAHARMAVLTGVA